LQYDAREAYLGSVLQAKTLSHFWWHVSTFAGGVAGLTVVVTLLVVTVTGAAVVVANRVVEAWTHLVVVVAGVVLLWTIGVGEALVTTGMDLVISSRALWQVRGSNTESSQVLSPGWKQYSPFGRTYNPKHTGTVCHDLHTFPRWLGSLRQDSVESHANSQPLAATMGGDGVVVACAAVVCGTVVVFAGATVEVVLARNDVLTGSTVVVVFAGSTVVVVFAGSTVVVVFAGSTVVVVFAGSTVVVVLTADTVVDAFGCPVVLVLSNVLPCLDVVEVVAKTAVVLALLVDVVVTILATGATVVVVLFAPTAGQKSTMFFGGQTCPSLLQHSSPPVESI